MNYPPRSEWDEIDQSVFLALPEHDQLLYCAQRDEDSAEHEDDPKLRGWFLQRAEWYREQIRALIPV